MKKWHDLDEAIIGQALMWAGNERMEVLIYSGEKVLGVLIKRDGMTHEEAQEFVDFNIEGAYIGPDTPLLMWPLEDL